MDRRTTDGTLLSAHDFDAQGVRIGGDGGRYAVVSTAHITAQDAKMLGTAAAMAYLPFTVAKFNEGFVISLRPDALTQEDQIDILKQIAAVGLSPAFAGLWTFLRTRGYGRLELDCDGAVISELPTFDW